MGSAATPDRAGSGKRMPRRWSYDTGGGAAEHDRLTPVKDKSQSGKYP